MKKMQIGGQIFWLPIRARKLLQAVTRGKSTICWYYIQNCALCRDMSPNCTYVSSSSHSFFFAFPRELFPRTHSLTCIARIYREGGSSGIVVMSSDCGPKGPGFDSRLCQCKMFADALLRSMQQIFRGHLKMLVEHSGGYSAVITQLERIGWVSVCSVLVCGLCLNTLNCETVEIEFLGLWR